MANRWYNRPHNLQRLLLAEIGVAGFGALEVTRRLFNGDSQWYTGFRGSSSDERPNTALDDWFESLFTSYSGLGDSFTTPEQAKVGQKRQRDGKAKKKLEISPADKSSNKRKEPPTSIEPPPKRPNLAIMSRQPQNATGFGASRSDQLKPFGATANQVPDYFTFRGKSVIYKQIDLNSRNTAGAPTNTVTTAQGIRLRLNSPADINLSTTGTDVNNVPLKGFTTWKAFYTHYRVIETKVSIYFNRRRWSIFTNTSAATSAANNIDHFYDDTPLVAGFVCDPSARLNDTLTGKDWRSILVGKHVASKYLTGGQQTGFNYTYTPESWDMSLQTAQKDQFWTPVDLNPPSQDLLYIFVAPCNANCTGTVDISIEVEMTVQMRELNTTELGKLYTTDALITTADNTNTTENMEGDAT